MTFQKTFSTKGCGFILYDIILSLAISGVFVSIVTVITFESRDIYAHARAKTGLIRVYKDHVGEFADLQPYEERQSSFEQASSTDGISITAKARWFGNDQIETDIGVSGGRARLDLTMVRRYVSPDGSDSAGTPLCEADFGEGDIDIAPIPLPIDPLLPLTDLIVRGGVAYISADSSVAGDSDLLIADIGHESQPSILSSLNTGPGLSAIALAHDRVFAAAASTAFQLHVIKLNGTNSIYLSKKFQLPLPEASTSPPTGSAIFYRDKKIYIGTEKWDGLEFSILDVSNPETPAVISGFETNSKINDIYVRGPTAYIAASGQSQLIALDLHDQSHPYTIFSFEPSGWQRQEGRSISRFEDAVSFGRTSGGFNIVNDKELFVFGSTSPITPVSFADVSGGVYGIVSDRSRVFAAARTLDRELSIFDPLSGALVAHHSLPVEPQTITCDGDRLYILAKSAPVIYEITIKKQ